MLAHSNVNLAKVLHFWIWHDNDLAWSAMLFIKLGNNLYLQLIFLYHHFLFEVK